jgi:hypothetical protein
MSTPDVPDPAETAAAQTASNVETATAQFELGATNQITPYGNLTYEQTGTSESGTPTYTATQTLTPDQQRLLDIGERTATTMGRTAEQQAKAVQSTLAEPIDLSNSATEAYLFDLGSAQLDPFYDEEQAQLETQLANQGIMPGSDAYVDAMNQFADQENDAYNELLLEGHQTATSDILTERNQPLNELNALMTGSQVTQPSYVTTPQPGVAPTDVAGITQAAYDAEQDQYEALLGGLTDVGTAVLGMPFWSDARLKTDIRKLGEMTNGIGIYTYAFKDTGRRQIGFIAQDVERIAPHAVIEVGGFKMVDYVAASRAK